MKASDAITTLEEVGAAQWGLVTTAQAGKHGVSRVALGRLRDDGIIHSVRRGVWALPSADHGPLQELRAAWLVTDPGRLATTRRGVAADVVVSHASAAVVHSLGDVIPSRHEFTATRRRQTTQSDVAFHRAELSEDITIVQGLPVTSISRTVGDLAASAVDFDHLAEIIRDALGSPDVQWRDLGSRLDPVAGRYGCSTGLELVDSSLEHAGLPAVVANLAESTAVVKALGPQWPAAFNQEILRAVLPRIRTPEFMAELAQEMGRVIAGQLPARSFVPVTGMWPHGYREGSGQRGNSSTVTPEGNRFHDSEGSES